MLGGVLPAVVAAVFSSLLLNWYFIHPIGTLTVADPENTLALVVFVLVGVLVALIVHRNARRTEQAQAAQRESAALAELSHSLLGATDQLPFFSRRRGHVRGLGRRHRPPATERTAPGRGGGRQLRSARARPITTSPTSQP